MISRREFLNRTGIAGTAALATFDPAGLPRLLAASQAAQGQDPLAIAANESYWREIQQAFTLDRTIINLNNGGVCPSPQVVHDALKRYLDISNQAPVYHMWQVLEPNIEGVRRTLAADAGVDPETLAITRNASEALQIAQLGLEPETGRRGPDDESGLRTHAADLGAARGARRDQADENLISRAALECGPRQAL